MESAKFGIIAGYLSAYAEMASFYRGGISFRFDLIRIPIDGDPIHSVKKHLLNELDEWGIDLSAWEKVFAKDTLADFEFQIMNYPLDAFPLDDSWKQTINGTVKFWFESSLINHQNIDESIYDLAIQTRVNRFFELLQDLIAERPVRVWQIDSMEHASFMNIFYDYLKNDHFILQINGDLCLLHFGMSE